MSTRSRAAPWFIERPVIYAHTLHWMGEPMMRQWSWNTITWFDYSGNVITAGTYGNEAVREFRKLMDEAYLAARKGEADLLHDVFEDAIQDARRRRS